MVQDLVKMKSLINKMVKKIKVKQIHYGSGAGGDVGK